MGTTYTSTQPGHPSFLHDDTGVSTYAAILLTLPKYKTYHVHATCGANGALISFDGMNDHMQVPANGEVQYYDLLLQESGPIYAKNLTGSNYADLKVRIW